MALVRNVNNTYAGSRAKWPTLTQWRRRRYNPRWDGVERWATRDPLDRNRVDVADRERLYPEKYVKDLKFPDYD